MLMLSLSLLIGAVLSLIMLVVQKMRSRSVAASAAYCGVNQLVLLALLAICSGFGSPVGITFVVVAQLVALALAFREVEVWHRREQRFRQDKQ